MVSIYRGERSSFRGASYFYVDRFHCLCHIFWISGLFLCFRLYCFDSKSLSWMKVKDWIPRPPDSHLCANVLLNLHSLHSLTYLDHTDVLEVIWTLLHRHISEVSANPWCICLLSNLFLFRSTFRWNYRFLVRMKSEKWYIFFWNFNFVYTEIWRLNPGRVIFFLLWLVHLFRLLRLVINLTTLCHTFTVNTIWQCLAGRWTWSL